MLLPILHVAAQAFSSEVAINKGTVGIFPVGWTLNNFRVIMGDSSVWRSFGISVFVTAAATLVSLFGTSTLGYSLSRPEFEGRKVVLIFILITLIFQAPLIPNYLVIKNLHMIDSLWALIIPSAISAYNLFIMRSFFTTLPNELIDCARIDGAGEVRIIWSIVLPLSKPAMATMGLFYAVSNWNAYSNALFFINDPRLYPLQLRLREVVLNDKMGESSVLMETLQSVSPVGVQMAVITFSILPIIMVYPFLQKYFIKGMLVGSIKS
jgi:putative aldouronate transport system permease protein